MIGKKKKDLIVLSKIVLTVLKVVTYPWTIKTPNKNKQTKNKK